MTESDLKSINLGERAGFNTGEHLANALRQAEERNYKDFLIIDVDAHHHENESWNDIVEYIEDPVLKHRAKATARGADAARGLVFSAPKRQDQAGRLARYQRRHFEVTEPEIPRDVGVIRRTMHAIGIDYQIVFPTPMLELGLHPDPQIESALSWAYTRWFVEDILPCDDRIKTLVYLPLNDPDACLRVVERYADNPSVVGFMIAAARRKPVHDNLYMRLYAAIQATGKPLAFHAVHDQQERMFEGMNKFISVHALGFVVFNMVHMTNWVMNGLPERFPNLDVIWIESGLAWVPFLMQRLDNEYMMRTSEAPLLKKKPSEYMAEMYYSTQPLEVDNLEALEVTFKMINAETQLMFASDYPHWDFDLPSTIYDLPFLDERAKRRILGGNASRLLKIKP